MQEFDKDTIKEYTTDDLRQMHNDIEDALVRRRDQVFFNIKEDLQRIIEMIRNEGYNLQVIDYDDEKKVVEVHNVMQFDLYDPAFETSQF